MGACFSLGEISAAAWASMFSAGAGFRLVAVLRLSQQTVRELCAGVLDVYPVISTAQGILAGLNDQMAPFCAAVKTAGGRMVSLRVGGAFHSPFMCGAAEAFGEELQRESFPPCAHALFQPHGPALFRQRAKAFVGADLLSRTLEPLVRNVIAAAGQTRSSKSTRAKPFAT